MRVKIGILEDELNEQQITLKLVYDFFNSNNIECECFVENNAKDFLKHNFENIDLILLDIIMVGELNGFDVAKKIREQNKRITIIFLTKTVQYAVKGYQVEAFDYMVKPLIYEDFSLKMQVFLKKLINKGRKTHVFKCKDSIVRLKERDILYIDIYKHYLTIYSTEGTYVTRGTMGEIGKELSNVFSRCSSNCYINLMHLDEIKKDDAIVNGKCIKITAKYKNKFLEDIALYFMYNE